MKKRGYIYVYAVFVMALLFMVVVSITEANINKNRIALFTEDYISQKYLNESNAYLAIDYFINPKYFSSVVIRHSRKNSGKELKETETLESVIEPNANFKVEYKSDGFGILNIYFRNYHDGVMYENKSSIKLFNDLYYISDNVVDLNKESEDYNKLIDSGYIDNYMEKVLFLDDFENITITNANGKLAYIKNDDSEDSPSDSEHVEDSSNLSQNTDNSSENQLDSESIKRRNIKDSSKDIFEEDSNISDDNITDDNANENESKEDDETTEELKDDTSEETDIEEPEEPIDEPKDDPAEEPPEETPNPDDEPDLIYIDSEIHETLVIGPSTKYISDSSLVLDGILKINSDTVIDADIVHSGLIILESEPKHIRGVINLKGALFSSIGQPSYINFESQKSRLEKHGSIFKGFFEPKVVDFHFSY